MVLEEYEKGGGGSWGKRESKWNVVCNRGMRLGGLGVGEDYRKEREIMLEKGGG